MALLTILTEENPILRTECKEIKYISKNIKQLIQDMKETMIYYNGVGLAAPQIGENIRLIVVRTSDKQLEMINPVIIDKQGLQEGTEQCLSCGDKEISIERYKTILVKYINKNNKIKILLAHDNLARCIQHEIDHLHGILITNYKKK